MRLRFFDARAGGAPKNRPSPPAPPVCQFSKLYHSPQGEFFAIIKSMHLELVTLRGKKVDQEIYEVTIPTEIGPIAVFPSHQAHVTLAVPGALAIRHKQDDPDDKLEYLAITGGVVKITDNTVRILVDEADHSEDILEEEAKSALARAQEMKKDAKSEVELEKAMELVDRQAVRLQVAALRRKRRL